MYILDHFCLGSLKNDIFTDVFAHHPLLAIFPLSSTAFCTHSMGSHDTLRHCQRACACRCGGKKIQGTHCVTQAGSYFQLFAQMAPWDTLGSGLDQHFAPELFAGTSKTTTFYKGFDVTAGHINNTAKTMVFEHVADLRYAISQGLADIR